MDEKSCARMNEWMESIVCALVFGMYEYIQIDVGVMFGLSYLANEKTGPILTSGF